MPQMGAMGMQPMGGMGMGMGMQPMGGMGMGMGMGMQPMGGMGMPTTMGGGPGVKPAAVPSPVVEELLSEPKVLLRPDLGGGLALSLVQRFGVVASTYNGATSTYVAMKNCGEQPLRYAQAFLTPNSFSFTTFAHTPPPPSLFLFRSLPSQAYQGGYSRGAAPHSRRGSSDAAAWPGGAPPYGSCPHGQRGQSTAP